MAPRPHDELSLRDILIKLQTTVEMADKASKERHDSFCERLEQLESCIYGSSNSTGIKMTVDRLVQRAKMIGVITTLVVGAVVTLIVEKLKGSK